MFPRDSRLSILKKNISEKTTSRMRSLFDEKTEEENEEEFSRPMNIRKTTSSLLFVGRLLKRLPTYKPNIDHTLNLSDINDLEKVKSILRKRREIRSMAELNQLARSFENIEFFQELKNGLEPVLYFRLFKEMILEEFRAGSYVFHLNDPPDKLYIVLSGEVFILAEKVPEIAASGEKGKKFEVVFQNFNVMNVMQKFQVFGEIALRNNTPRTASAACQTNCDLVSIDKKTFRTVLRAFFDGQATEKLDYLSKIPLFKGVQSHYLQGLLLHLKERKFKKDEVIFTEGAKLDSLYIIREGEVQAWKKMNLEKWRDEMIENECYSKEKIREVIALKDMEKFRKLNISWDKKLKNANKKSQILFCLGKGEFFGEMGLFSGKNTAEYTMVCKSLKLVLLVISYQKIVENIKGHEKIGKTEIRTMKAKIKEQQTIFSKAMQTESLIMKGRSRLETDRDLPDDIAYEDEKIMQNTATVRFIRPENQAYELRNKVNYHYSTRYLPSNLLLTREIKEKNDDDGFKDFTLEKNLIKMFNPQRFNMRKVNSNNSDFIKGNKDLSQKSVRPFTEIAKNLESTTKQSIPNFILYKSLGVNHSEVQKAYQICSETLISTQRKRPRINKEITREEMKAKRKNSCENEKIYNFCNIGKIRDG